MERTDLRKEAAERAGAIHHSEEDNQSPKKLDPAPDGLEISPAGAGVKAANSRNLAEPWASKTE
jgi:hypothetical protein